MKALVLRRVPFAFLAAAALSAAAAIPFSLEVSVPFDHVRLAWTLTRVLIQL